MQVRSLAELVSLAERVGVLCRLPDIVAEAGRAVGATYEGSPTKVLSLAPNHARAHWILGSVQMFTNRAAQGIAECEQALTLDRNLAVAHAYIGLGSVSLVRVQKPNLTSTRHSAFLLGTPWLLDGWYGSAKPRRCADAEAGSGCAGASTRKPELLGHAFPTRGLTRAAGEPGRDASHHQRDRTEWHSKPSW